MESTFFFPEIHKKRTTFTGNNAIIRRSTEKGEYHVYYEDPYYSLNTSIASHWLKTMLLHGNTEQLQHSKRPNSNITRNQVPSLHHSMPTPILHMIYIQVVPSLKQLI
jgi:hypothetical protein